MRMIMLAALLAATPALAQEPPTTIDFGRRSGTFETPGDVDRYRIRLVQGRDYAFGLNSTFGDVRGEVDGCRTGAFEAEGYGCEFRAGRTGWFFIKISEAGGEADVGYSFRIHPDCRDDTRTRCQIKPGATQSHALAWGEDIDLVRLASLTAGRSYTAALLDPPICAQATLSIVKADGGQVGAAGAFKATAAALYAKVQGRSAFCTGGTYKLTLR